MVHCTVLLLAALAAEPGPPVTVSPETTYLTEPMRYRRTDDGCILYSVGPNGRDDGGRNATWDWDDDSLAEDADDIYLRLPPRVR